MAPGTPLDNMMKSKNMLLAFSGMVTAVGVWAVCGGNIFPSESDPTGDPAMWTIEELQRWLRKRNLDFNNNASKEEMVEWVQTLMARASRARR